MEADVEEMGAQLKLWSTKIHGIAEQAQKAGARTRFEDLVHVDELKALHAIAQSKFDQFGAAGKPERARLRSELKRAWNELDAAFKDPKTLVKAAKARKRGGSLTPPVPKAKRHKNPDQG
jgi:hypothetical protein